MKNRRWIVLALIFLGIVINYIDRGNLSIAAPSMMSEFHIAPAKMGLLLSAFFWTYAAFQIPIGLLVDRFGIRWAYAGGFLVWSIASAAIAFSRGTGDVIGFRLALGLAESIAPLASLAFIRRNFKGEEQGLPTSIYIAGQNVGPAIGALVGALLLDHFGWRMMFLITGLGGLLWLPGWLMAVPRESPSQVADDAAAVHDASGPRLWTWRALLSNWTFWVLSVAVLLHSYYWYFVLTWVPSYLILSRGFSTIGMGKVISTALLTMAGVNILAGTVVDKVAARIGVFRARLAFMVVAYMATSSILLLLVTPERSVTLPILTFAMSADGIGNSNYWATSQHVPPKHMVARTVGYLNTLGQVAGVAAPVITGLLLGPQKHFGPAIVIAGVCPVMAAVLLFSAGAKGLTGLKALLAGEVGA